jgi:hypothetical protein
MNASAWAAIIVSLAAFSATAQRPDCPVRDAPRPSAPPGKPPEFLPKFTFPEVWGEEVKTEAPLMGPSSEELIDAEEGHVTAVARTTELAHGPAPAEDILRLGVDPGKTDLSGWRFEGYVREMPRQKVTRVFTRHGSTLVFEEWNFAADGARVYPTRQPSTAVGPFPATWGGLRAPSGCVSTALTWGDDKTNYSLRLVGPLSLDEQRALLLRVARSIASQGGGKRVGSGR